MKKINNKKKIKKINTKTIMVVKYKGVGSEGVQQFIKREST